MQHRRRCAPFVSVQDVPLQTEAEKGPKERQDAARVREAGGPWMTPALDGSGGYMLWQCLNIEMPLQIGASAAAGDAYIGPGQQTMEWGKMP